MKRLVLVILVVLFTSSVYAQRMLLPVWTEGEERSTVGLFGFGSYASDALNNRFALALTQGSFLERSMREAQAAQLSKENNRVGAHYSFGLQGRLHPFNDRSWSLLFSMTDEAFGEGAFTPEAYALAFFGNEPYRGDTLSLGGNYLRFARFQKFGFGVGKRSDYGVSYGLMLSFVNGESAFNANMSNAWLYTSALGDTLSAYAGGNLFLSDTGNTGLLKHNGAGAMIDFYLSQNFEFLGRNWRAKAAVLNMGVVQWRPSTEHFRMDTTLQWTGVRLDDIMNLEQQVNAIALEDSVDALMNSDRWRGPINQVMPGLIQLAIDQVGGKGFNAGFGVTFRPESFAFPYGYILPRYSFSDRFSLDAELGYGGYAGIQTGLAARYMTEQWALRLRAANLEAIAAPGRFGGLTLAGSLQYFFDL